MRIAIYPGSFDPITNGHLDIIAKVSPLFDSVIVSILHNPQKSPLFSIEERVELIRRVVSSYGNVTVDSFSGLLVTYAAKVGAVAVVRGLRDAGDFDTEFRMAQMNLHLNSTVTTLFLPTHPQFAYISSSLVKEIAEHGGNLTGLTPDAVRESLCTKYGRDNSWGESDD